MFFSVFFSNCYSGSLVVFSLFNSDFFQNDYHLSLYRLWLYQGSKEQQAPADPPVELSAVSGGEKGAKDRQPNYVTPDSPKEALLANGYPPHQRSIGPATLTPPKANGGSA